MSSMFELRAKYALGTNSELITAICITVVLLGAVIAFSPVLTPAIAASPLHESQSGGTTTHSAGASQSVDVLVTEDSTAYSTGEVLTDKSRYPSANTANPVITANADAQQATITHVETVLTYEAGPRSEPTDTFYSDSEVLTEETGETTQVTMTPVIDINEIRSEKQALQDEFGGEVSVTATITTEVTYEYPKADANAVERTLETGGLVQFSGRMYSLPSDSTQQTHETGEPPAETTALTTLMNLTGVIAIVIGLVGIGVASVASQKLDVGALKRDLQKRRFREWVTEVESYTPQGSVHTVEVKSLNDLVNLAIDTQRRVLYHAQVNEYIVVDNSTMFKYRPDKESSGGTTEFFGMDPDELDLTSIPGSPGLPEDFLDGGTPEEEPDNK